MIENYTDRMGHPTHIRTVGPHPHQWVKAGTDSRMDVYEECALCGTRRARGPAPGRAPLRNDWLQGGPWEPEADAAKAKPARTESADDLESLKHDDLMALARKRDVDLPSGYVPKDGLVKALRKAAK